MHRTGYCWMFAGQCKHPWFNKVGFGSSWGKQAHRWLIWIYSFTCLNSLDHCGLHKKQIVPTRRKGKKRFTASSGKWLVEPSTIILAWKEKATHIHACQPFRGDAITRRSINSSRTGTGSLQVWGPEKDLEKLWPPLTRPGPKFVEMIHGWQQHIVDGSQGKTLAGMSKLLQRILQTVHGHFKLPPCTVKVPKHELKNKSLQLYK